MKSKRDKNYSYEYPRPALTVDAVLLTREATPRVLLIRRGKPPFEGLWAFPGGFVEEGESLVNAAKRELQEETGLVIEDLEQLHTAGDPGRDPRGWTVSVVFLARIDAAQVHPKAADDASAVDWFPLDKLPELAFDHAAILERAAARVRDRRP